MISAKEAHAVAQVWIDKQYKESEERRKQHQRDMEWAATCRLVHRLPEITKGVRKQAEKGQTYYNHYTHGGTESEWDLQAAKTYFEPYGYEMTLERPQDTMLLAVVLHW